MYMRKRNRDSCKIEVKIMEKGRMEIKIVKKKEIMV